MSNTSLVQQTARRNNGAHAATGRDETGTTPTYSASFFPQLDKPRGHQKPQTAQQLAELFSTCDIRPDKDGALISGAIYAPDNVYRSGENVLAVSMLQVDCDEDFKLSELCELIEQTGAPAFLYSTHSHGTPDTVKHPNAHAPGERYRAAWLLSEPINAADYPNAWERANRLFEGEIDAACKDASRAFYLPSHPTGDGFIFRAFNLDAPPLRVADLPELPPEPARPQYHPTGSGDGDGRPGDDYNAQATNEDTAQILEAHGWTVTRSQANRWKAKRPGKSGPGISATVGHHAPGVLHVFSSNAAPFESGHAYKPYSVLGLLQHGGDFKATSKVLAASGYGSTPKTPTITNDGATFHRAARAYDHAPATGKVLPINPEKTKATDDDFVFDFSTDEKLDECFTGIKWEWENYIPRGFVTALVAEQEAGKSTVAQSFCDVILRGDRWPDGQPHTPRPDTKLLWIDTEGTLSLFHDRMKQWDMPRGRFILPPDPLQELTIDDARTWVWIEKAIEKFNPPMVVIDALSGAHNAQANSEDEMKLVMKRLSGLAQRHQIALIVIHHLSKPAPGMKAFPVTIHRLRGSTAISQYCRSIIALGAPDESRPDSKRLDVIKLNLAKKPPAVGYELTDFGPAWGEAPEPPKERRAIDNAIDFLSVALANGARESKGLEEEAKQAGVGRNALFDAKKVLKIAATREGGKEGRWFWAPAKNTVIGAMEEGEA